MRKLPEWLHIKREKFPLLSNKILKSHHLNSVCEAAKCPNRLECFSKKRTTFLVLGKVCTRGCPFCNINASCKGEKIDISEPTKIALAVKELQLQNIIITMVSRDDLEDGGAAHLGKIIDSIRKENSCKTVEVLTSDFNGNLTSLNTLLDKKPDIFAHNIETVRSLTDYVRRGASYDRSLMTLKIAKNSNKTKSIKSGLLLGFGEKEDEVKCAIHDLLDVGCDIVTIGQYLPPTEKHLKVESYIPPEKFKFYEEFALKIGIKKVASAPFVRSSYLTS